MFTEDIFEQRTVLDTIADYVLVFAEFSFMGWVYEVVLAFIYGLGFVNRGFLYGPFLPIYGVGGVILVFLLGRLIKQKIYLGVINITPLLVFLGIMLITTSIELGVGLGVDVLLDRRLWDYSHYSFNFLGLISLSTSLRFGIGGMVMLYLILPLFNLITSRFSSAGKRMIATIFLVYLLGDFILIMLRDTPRNIPISVEMP